MTLPLGLHLNVSHDDYHSDPCEQPSLSSHCAGTLLSKSPLHAWTEHPRLGGVRREKSSEALDRGTLIDLLVLGNGPELVEVNADDWRTKTAKEQREAAVAAGKVAVLASKLDAVLRVAQRIKSNLPYKDFDAQTTAIWKWCGCFCRCRSDMLTRDRAKIVDLKTCEDISAATSGSYVVKYGYHIQAAANLEGVIACGGEPGRVEYLLHFVETEAPFTSVTASLSGELLELGQRQWKRAKEIWAGCIRCAYWPGPNPVKRIEAPAWALAQDMEQQMSAIEGGSKDVSF